MNYKGNLFHMFKFTLEDNLKLLVCICTKYRANTPGKKKLFKAGLGRFLVSGKYLLFFYIYAATKRRLGQNDEPYRLKFIFGLY